MEVALLGNRYENELPPENERHVLLIEKHPPARLMPPVPYRDVVAVVKFATLFIESIDPGVVVPSPKFPVAESKRNPLIPELPKRTVEDACTPFVSSNVEDVAEVSVPKFIVGVNGYVPAPAPAVSDSQPKIPFCHVSIFSVEQFVRPAPKNFVVEAVPDIAIFVVVALVPVASENTKFCNVD